MHDLNTNTNKPQNNTENVPNLNVEPNVNFLRSESTRFCRYFRRGNCFKGENECCFLHQMPPECRFGESCRRINNCRFTHSHRRGGDIREVYQHRPRECKWGEKCRRTVCNFYHSNQSSYGNLNRGSQHRRNQTTYHQQQPRNPAFQQQFPVSGLQHQQQQQQKPQQFQHGSHEMSSAMTAMHPSMILREIPQVVQTQNQTTQHQEPMKGNPQQPQQQQMIMSPQQMIFPGMLQPRSEGGKVNSFLVQTPPQVVYL